MNADRVLATLIRHEGLRNKPYRCSAGKLTIGIGRNIEDNGITDDEAKFLARNDMRNAIKGAYRHLQDFGKHDDVRREVVVMMIFQLGIPRFLLFKNMIAALNRGDYAVAAAEMRNSKWAKKDSPGRASELAEMMVKGQYVHGGGGPVRQSEGS